ncbi:prefoldin subunit 1 [Cryptococcus deuterogattii 99/473]|nr:prefoldin subunit 1 [Cryptococcus deuterogattii 99/473]
MSTLSDDTLRKILVQIQTQAITSQKQLAVVKTQITSKEKERRILALQVKELGNIPGDGGMYKGVGKISTPKRDKNKARLNRDINLIVDGRFLLLLAFRLN